MELYAAANDANRRLDRVLRVYFNTMPLSAIHRLLRQGKIRLGGRKASAASRVAAGDLISIDVDIINGRSDSDAPKSASTSKLIILAETKHWIILSKPTGIAVHGQSSLDTELRRYLEGRIEASLSFKCGPLHRLDKGTSGIIVFSKSLSGAQAFSEALQKGAVRKRYIAILEGALQEPCLWTDQLYRASNSRISIVSVASSSSPGLLAISKVWPLAYSNKIDNRPGNKTSPNNYTLALVEIETGRTHQIRAQAASRGHPLVGDRLYGALPCAQPFFLHAYELIIDPLYDPDKATPLCAPPPLSFLHHVNEYFGPMWSDHLEKGLSSDEMLRL